MRFSSYLIPLALATGVLAGQASVVTETVVVVEYTEVCQCPTATPLLLLQPAITTITCCDTCAPVTVTATDQLVTSCASTTKPTSTVCNEVGIYHLGEDFYPCNEAPCTIQYNAPCPTCYVCAYSDCWAPGAMINSKPKNVKVYEYFGSEQVGYCEENWWCSVFPC